MPRLKVGFWNIEKASSPNRINPNGPPDPARPLVLHFFNRRQFVLNTVVRWWEEWGFDVLFFGELVRGGVDPITEQTQGEEFIGELVRRLNFSQRLQTDRLFAGEFIPSNARVARANTCNYGAVWNTDMPAVEHPQLIRMAEIDAIRDTIVFSARGINLGFLHAKSAIMNRRGMQPRQHWDAPFQPFERAEREIVESCNLLYQNTPRGCATALIGDMNVPPGDFNYADRMTLQGASWSFALPGMDVTHVGHAEEGERYFVPPSLLDYLIGYNVLEPEYAAADRLDDLNLAELAQLDSNNPRWQPQDDLQGRLIIKAVPPLPDYDAWRWVDHAPIQYILSY